MRRKLADIKADKAEGTSDGSLALFGQQASSSSKRKGKREWKHITCYRSGRKATSNQMPRWRKEGQDA